MTQALRIGVAGLGTVGGGTLALLEAHGELIAERCGRPVLVSAVSARDRRKDRGLALSAVRWFEDAAAMAADPEIDVVIELIGGADGTARDLVQTALAVCRGDERGFYATAVATARALVHRQDASESSTLMPGDFGTRGKR